MFELLIIYTHQRNKNVVYKKMCISFEEAISFGVSESTAIGLSNVQQIQIRPVNLG